MDTPNSPIVHPLAKWLQPWRIQIHNWVLKLPPILAEFVFFGLKMAWSCLFGGSLLALLLLTHWFWPPQSPLARYDFLLAAAVFIQLLMLWTRLESFEELKVIMAYHVIGTIMEVFKTHMGSWQYPEDSIIRLAGVPLFTGFMYGTVGSFMARSIRVFAMHFENYPKTMHTIIIALAIYINFFTHHFIFDLRYIILFGIFIAYWRTNIHFRPLNNVRKMPLLLAAMLTSFFMWIAENIGTLTKTWVYAGQKDHEWKLVSIQKMGSWFLLLFISFTIVMIVLRINEKGKAHPN